MSDEPTAHTDRRFEAELRDLEGLVLDMAGRCREVVSEAVRALVEGDEDAAERIVERDRDLNASELELDQRAVRLLALEQPVASDLRLIVAALKIVVDLERIGDEAVELARHVPRLARDGLRPLLRTTLPEMSRQVTAMLEQCERAFRERDVPLAERALTIDEGLEALEEHLLREAVEFMTRHPSPEDVDSGLALVGCAKYLGRIADHCTNFAEMVVFAVEGREVGHRELPSKI